MKSTISAKAMEVAKMAEVASRKPRRKSQECKRLRYLVAK
jgi:hypothetical protein